MDQLDGVSLTTRYFIENFLSPEEARQLMMKKTRQPRAFGALRPTTASHATSRPVHSSIRRPTSAWQQGTALPPVGAQPRPRTAASLSLVTADFTAHADHIPLARPHAGEAAPKGMRSSSRHAHAHAMAGNRDRLRLAEDWRQLVSQLNPAFPVSTPIAEDVDSHSLAYAILLVKEGKHEIDMVRAPN